MLVASLEGLPRPLIYAVTTALTRIEGDKAFLVPRRGRLARLIGPQALSRPSGDAGTAWAAPLSRYVASPKTPSTA